MLPLNTFTDTTAVRAQLPVTYEIKEVPDEMPDTRPVAELMVATPVDTELHIPPVVAELRSAVLPTHIESGPVIAPGVVPTVSTVVVRQPVGRV
jgi:hypothetical protein